MAQAFQDTCGGGAMYRSKSQLSEVVGGAVFFFGAMAPALAVPPCLVMPQNVRKHNAALEKIQDLRRCWIAHMSGNRVTRTHHANALAQQGMNYQCFSAIQSCTKTDCDRNGSAPKLTVTGTGVHEKYIVPGPCTGVHASARKWAGMCSNYGCRMSEICRIYCK